MPRPHHPAPVHDAPAGPDQSTAIPAPTSPPAIRAHPKHVDLIRAGLIAAGLIAAGLIRAHALRAHAIRACLIRAHAIITGLIRARPAVSARPIVRARRRHRLASTPTAAASTVILFMTAAPLLCPSPASAEPESWRWPLDGRPRILHRYAPPPERWLAGHRGVDLAAPPGTPVLAAGPGVVRHAGPLAGRGVVSIEHLGGLRTTYLPVTTSVQPGQHVSQGDHLGVVAASPSHCTESCLHWGLVREPFYLDPLLLLGRSRVRLLPFWPEEQTSRTATPTMEPGPAPPLPTLAIPPHLPALTSSSAPSALPPSMRPALIAASPFAPGRTPPPDPTPTGHGPHDWMTSHGPSPFAPRLTPQPAMPPAPDGFRTARAAPTMARPAPTTPSKQRPAQSTHPSPHPSTHSPPSPDVGSTFEVSSFADGRARGWSTPASERTALRSQGSDRSPPNLTPRSIVVSAVTGVGTTAIFGVLLLMALRNRRTGPRRVDTPRGRRRRGRHRRPASRHRVA
ncbi:MAG: peptidoglycan DD-metalloendopeptidase family protein [Nonomuraea muscovyensis]|nr:peptidoglycan DD-metalloendopeptidase family protein [Nonomuraea muscovyensis]